MADDSISYAFEGLIRAASGFNGVGKMIISNASSGSWVFDLGMANASGLFFYDFVSCSCTGAAS